MEFKNAGNFREVVSFALLFARNVVVANDEPFDDFELRFLDLVALVSKGSRVILSNGNRTLHFKPGSLETDADADLSFNCQRGRSVTYFAEPLLLLALFSRNGLRIVLDGITNDSADLTVDALKDGLLPLLKASYGSAFSAELKINQRGFRPSCNGQVFLTVSAVRPALPPLQVKPQKAYIKRIRGTVITSKTSAQFMNRAISRVREVFNDYIPDVWVYSLLVKNSPDTFYGVSLHTSNFIVAEASYDKVLEGAQVKTPEEVADEACLGLLDDIRFSSGFIPTSFASTVLTLMGLGKGVSAVPLGRLTEQSVGTLRLLRAFSGVKFDFENLPGEDEEAPVVLARCTGAGLLNRATELV